MHTIQWVTISKAFPKSRKHVSTSFPSSMSRGAVFSAIRRLFRLSNITLVCAKLKSWAFCILRNLLLFIVRCLSHGCFLPSYDERIFQVYPLSRRFRCQGTFDGSSSDRTSFCGIPMPQQLYQTIPWPNFRVMRNGSFQVSRISKSLFWLK